MRMPLSSLECPDCRERVPLSSFRRGNSGVTTIRRLEVEEKYNWKNVYFCPACQSPFMQYGILLNTRLFETIIFFIVSISTLWTFFNVGMSASTFVFFTTAFVGGYLEKENRHYRVVELYKPNE